MSRALPVIWSVALAALMLWHALAAGFVLTFDMVWVPNLALRPDFLGLGSALPRAVPSDAVIAVLDEVVPGMLLQKLVLVGALVGGGLGAARLVGDLGLVPQLVAVSVWQWNPFVVERLVLGHWPVLVGYAVLPWLVLTARSARREERFPLALCLLLPLGALSASAGMMTAVVALVLGLGRRARTNLALVGAVFAANAPWLLSGLAHAGAATTDAAGAEVFALHDAGWLPGPLAALGLGGTWNTEVVPASRDGALGTVALLLLLGLCALGARTWWRARARRESVGLLACWGVGWLVATLTWAAPGVMGAFYEAVPGAGLVRDGGRLLALCAPLVVVLAAHGAAQLAVRAAGTADRTGVVRVAAAGGMMLFPIAVLPDAAWGVGGALQATDYPHSYAQAADAIDDRAREVSSGDVVVLPFTSYRAPDWNGGRKVLDPLGRYLSPDFVVSDDLVVDGRRIPGEDPRAAQVRTALEADTAREREAALTELGVAFVVTDKGAVIENMPESLVPRVSGTGLLGGDVEVTLLQGSQAQPAPTAARAAALAGWAGFGGLLLVGLGHSMWSARRFLSSIW